MQAFSQDYDLVSHSTYVVCVNFIREWRDLQFKKSIPNDRFMRNFFMAILFALRLFARNLLRGSRRRNIFIFWYWCLTWDLNLGLTSYKPTHYLLDHDDLNTTRVYKILTTQERVQRVTKIYYIYTLSFSDHVWMSKNKFEWLESFIKIYSLSSCCIYKKKKKGKTASKANTQQFSEYWSVRTRIILVLWFL